MCGISGIVLEKKNIFSLKKDIKEWYMPLNIVARQTKILD